MQRTILLILLLSSSPLFAQGNNMYPKITFNEWFQGNLRYVTNINKFDDNETLEWQPGTGVKGLTKAKGGGYLEIALAAETPALAEIVRKFEAPIDMTAAPVLYFAVRAPRSVPKLEHYYVTVTASDGTAQFSRKTNYVAGDWSVLTVNFEDCPFKNNIKSLRFVFGIDSRTPTAWQSTVLYLGVIYAAKMFDMNFAAEGDTQGFTARGGTLDTYDDCLQFAVTETGAAIESPVDVYNKQFDAYYGLPGVRNTIYFVMKNATAADQMTVSFSNASNVWAGSKTIKLETNATEFKLYKVNFSGNPQWNDQIRQFKITFPAAINTGKISIDRISFEEDEEIYSYSGKINSVTFNKASGSIRVDGTIAESAIKANVGGKLAFYAVYPPDPDEIVLTAKPLHTVDLSTLPVVDGQAAFSVADIHFMKSETKTLLDTDVLAVIINGDKFTKVDKRKSAENWRELIDGKYLFDNPGTVFDVANYGAKGDGFTDDTDAIQDAVDAATAAGGGKVLLSGRKTYIATNILLKDNVTFFIESGSVLRQSPDLRHYKYPLELGHWSKSFSHLPWAGCANLPLIQADGAVNIKVTGGGLIRMSEVDNLSDYFLSRLESNGVGKIYDCLFNVCAQRLHIVPIGFFDVKGCEISDIEVTRVSIGHFTLVLCENITIANVRLHEVRCLSGDAFGLFGDKNAVIYGVKYMSNDDGVVLWTTFHEPRFFTWCSPMPSRDQSVRNIEVYSSYMAASSDGRAIAFCPWGSNSPDLEKTMIQGITVKDCTLAGKYTAKGFLNRSGGDGWAVGAWADNPFNGKYPFDGRETDDYSCIQDVTILNNVYLGKCSISPVIATNCVTDCGIKSASNFVNRDFAAGLTYWSKKGKARVIKIGGVKTAEIKAVDGVAELFQGLHLDPGDYQFSFNVKSADGCVLFVRNSLTEVIVAETQIDASDFQLQKISATITVAGTYHIGVRTGGTAYVNTP